MFFLRFTAAECFLIFSFSEAAIYRCSLEEVFWKYAASLQENTYAKVQFQ